ncbi:MAG: DUF2252 domain-containing protein [Candidatus Obscuribacterales bacterium]|nr:DUF2252 domain-containing protein [Candidatus Obscuribacterales bacterium]
MVSEKKKSNKSTSTAQTKSKATKQHLRKSKKTKKTRESKKSAAEFKASAPIEPQNPDVAFLRPSLNAAFLKKPAHLRKTDDRMELGRAFRVQCPRESHSEMPIADQEARKPIDLLVESSAGRQNNLLPLRYGRMMASPFAFFRGAAVIMAADLANAPSTEYAVQACGDCHLLNFGAFATPERHVVFDINDFDETFPAPWEWDLKRLAASVYVAGQNNGHPDKNNYAAAIRTAQAYRDRMIELTAMPALSAWYSFIDYNTLIDLSETAALKKRRKKVLERELSKDAQSEFVKLGHVIGEQPKIKDRPPLVFHEDEQNEPEYQEQQAALLSSYRDSLPLERRVLFDRYELADTAVKVVGVGSVGTYCSIGLFFAAENDPLFLQFKEARASVLEPYVNFPPFQTHGERVVFGQKLMQAASDIFLGHALGLNGRNFYIRQLRDVKVKPMVEIYTPKEMYGYARNCGWALAMAHARSGDPAIISGYIGKSDIFPTAIGDFSRMYAEQNKLDHAALIKAVRDGIVEATLE